MRRIASHTSSKTQDDRAATRVEKEIRLSGIEYPRWRPNKVASMSVEKKCPKCQNEMEEGFIPDGIGPMATRITEWYAGAAEKSVWFGLSTMGKTSREIRTYRCTKCGFLESYAD
jgi:phage FluMu protein Com